MGKLKNDIAELIEYGYRRGLDGSKIATRLIEAGMEMMADEGAIEASNRIVPDFKFGTLVGFHVSTFIEGSSADDGHADGMATMLSEAGAKFDFYARNHIAKGPEHLEKAKTNVDMATRCYEAIGADDWRASLQAPETGQESDSAPVAGGSASALLKAILAAESDDQPMLGVEVHLDDQPILATLVELRYLNRDDVSDKVTITTKGKEAIGVRPDGVPDLPVEVASVTGNIEERELAARYIDGKIKGIESWIAKHPGDAEKHDYEIMARVMIEIAHEFRIGLHLPTIHLEGRVIPYNETHDTGRRHADVLRAFYEDVHGRNVKAGWWTDLKTGEPKLRNLGELLMLFVTEIWEAYAAYYSNSNDDKLTQYPGLGVELGDLEIRLADLCGALLAGRVAFHSNARNPGEELFKEVGLIAERYEAIRKTPEAVGDPELGEAMPSMDVAVMVDAKLDYNASRADHKIENRLKDDGKKT